MGPGFPPVFTDRSHVFHPPSAERTRAGGISHCVTAPVPPSLPRNSSLPGPLSRFPSHDSRNLPAVSTARPSPPAPRTAFPPCRGRPLVNMAWFWIAEEGWSLASTTLEVAQPLLPGGVGPGAGELRPAGGHGLPSQPRRPSGSPPGAALGAGRRPCQRAGPAPGGSGPPGQRLGHRRRADPAHPRPGPAGPDPRLPPRHAAGLWPGGQLRTLQLRRRTAALRALPGALPPGHPDHPHGRRGRIGGRRGGLAFPGGPQGLQPHPRLPAAGLVPPSPAAGKAGLDPPLSRRRRPDAHDHPRGADGGGRQARGGGQRRPLPPRFGAGRGAALGGQDRLRLPGHRQGTFWPRRWPSG